MSFTFIPVNGKNPNFDYEAFETSARKILPPTCNEATIILFNNFPVLVSSQSSIELIIVIALKDEKGNFYGIRKGNKIIYLHNLIIPVSIINNLEDASLTLDDENYLLADNQPIDYSSEVDSIRYGLRDYLVRKCNFIKQDLFIKPMIYIKNQKTFYLENILVCQNLDFKQLMIFVSTNTQEILCSYKNWKVESGYQSLPYDIERINNQASFDSEVGFLTMKKIKRITKQLSNEREIFNDLNKHLIIVSGKAGTGKTSVLLLLIMRCIRNGKNTQFLTYNNLLMFDVAQIIHTFRKPLIANRKEDEKIGAGLVNTLHRFFFRVSRKLGVQHLLSEKRITELVNILKTRASTIQNFIQEYNQQEGVSILDNTEIEHLKEKIQNHKVFDIPTKEVGIDFVNFMKKKQLLDLEFLIQTASEFIRHKTKQIHDITPNSVFLQDYYGVLRATLLAVTDKDSFIKKYEMQKKFELLFLTMDLKDEHLVGDKKDKEISEKALKEKLNRSIGGHKGKGTVFVDEAQDCHPLEKEILFAIYGSENIVISSGGKEQLIRHVELCDWTKADNKKIGYKPYPTSNKSYRIKKSVLHFCNFVAEKYKIKLKLDPLETEDEGELIFDFRNQPTNKEVEEIFDGLSLKGQINKCSALESILVLIDSSSKSVGGFDIIEDGNIVTGKINEYNNIEDSVLLLKSDWKYKGSLEENSKILFWDGAVDSKSDLLTPYSTETRLIFYESCRGIEAWSVACFSIDKFFNQKREDPDAEKYLVDDLFLSLQNEERKDMYAGTWVLMAITRAIDTLYLKFDNTDSSFSKVVLEYITQNPTAAKVLR